MDYQQLEDEVAIRLDEAEKMMIRPARFVLNHLKDLTDEEIISVIATMPPETLRGFVAYNRMDLELLLSDFFRVEVFGIE